MRELPFERAFREWVEHEGMRWERLRYPRPAAGGETVAYRIAPAAPPRAVALAVHGAGNDALFAFVGLFKALLRRRIEVFTFDLDGHGRHSTTVFQPGAAVEAVHEAVERCGAAARGLPLHALGVSLGGAILLRALPRLAPRPASAALLVAPLQIRFSTRAVLTELGIPLLRTLWREREHYGLAGLIPSFGPYKRDLYPLRLAHPAGPGGFAYVDALNAGLAGLRLEEAAGAVRGPVLLVYGDRDRLVPSEQGERLRALIPDATLLRLAGETHLSTPLAPAAVARLLAWIEEHTPAGEAAAR